MLGERFLRLSPWVVSRIKTDDMGQESWARSAVELGALEVIATRDVVRSGIA